MACDIGKVSTRHYEIEPVEEDADPKPKRKGTKNKSQKSTAMGNKSKKAKTAAKETTKQTAPTRTVVGPEENRKSLQTTLPGTAGSSSGPSAKRFDDLPPPRMEETPAVTGAKITGGVSPVPTTESGAIAEAGASQSGSLVELKENMTKAFISISDLNGDYRKQQEELILLRKDFVLLKNEVEGLRHSKPGPSTSTISSECFTSLRAGKIMFNLVKRWLVQVTEDSIAATGKDPPVYPTRLPYHHKLPSLTEEGQVKDILRSELVAALKLDPSLITDEVYNDAFNLTGEPPEGEGIFQKFQRLRRQLKSDVTHKKIKDFVEARQVSNVKTRAQWRLNESGSGSLLSPKKKPATSSGPTAGSPKAGESGESDAEDEEEERDDTEQRPKDAKSSAVVQEQGGEGDCDEQDGTEGSDQEDESSEDEESKCFFFKEECSGMLYDAVFKSKNPFDARNGPRVLSLYQLAMLDYFVTTRARGGVTRSKAATGNDPDIFETVEGICDVVDKAVKKIGGMDKRLCECCHVVDLFGYPTP